MIRTRLVFAALLWLTFSSVGIRNATAQETTAPKYPLAVAAAGNEWFVVDRKLPGVWKFGEGSPSVLARGGSKSRSPLNVPLSIARTADGKILVGDSATRNVYQIEADKEPAPLLSQGVGIPSALAVDSTGTLYVADLESKSVLKGNIADGKLEKLIDRAGVRGLAIDAEGGLWILAAHEPQLTRHHDGKTETMVAQGFRFPMGLAVRGSNEWFVADPYEPCVYRGQGNGAPEKYVADEALKYPTGLALAGETLLICDPHAAKVWKFAEGKLSP